ncbi:MAG: response regulator [Acidobacteriia bacterium]|nr:response regulator [Terriglobia bacterium]
MRTLLVADDNRLSRELIREVLESADCRVMEAANGQEALARLKETDLDLVLLDLEMPVKDGFAVLAAIRNNPRFSGLPVMAVTAKAMQTDRDRIVGAGFDAYIIKPINSAELRRQVNELLSLPRPGGVR